MQKVMLAAVIYGLLFGSGTVRPVIKEKLRWMNLAEAEAAGKTDKRPILIDLYTNWCGWCKVMDKKTYSDKNVVSYIQKNFYPVRLDAETKSTIVWSGKNFQYNAANRVNDIAMYLTEGRLAFPSTIFIPAGNAGPQAIAGYYTPKELEIILKYFGEEQFGKISFEDYRKKFVAEW